MQTSHAASILLISGAYPAGRGGRSLESFFEIIKQRKMPGIILIVPDQSMVYSNEEALHILADLKGQSYPGGMAEGVVPADIGDFPLRLHSIIREALPSCPGCKVLNSSSGKSYVMRAFPIGSGVKADAMVPILCLLEGAVEKHSIDFEKAGRDFHFSRREQDVLKLLCQGLSNRAISERLFISECTVKGHMKNIMAKTAAPSRSSIIALLVK